MLFAKYAFCRRCMREMGKKMTFDLCQSATRTRLVARFSACCHGADVLGCKTRQPEGHPKRSGHRRTPRSGAGGPSRPRDRGDHARAGRRSAGCDGANLRGNLAPLRGARCDSTAHRPCPGRRPAGPGGPGAPPKGLCANFRARQPPSVRLRGFHTHARPASESRHLVTAAGQAGQGTPVSVTSESPSAAAR